MKRNETSARGASKHAPVKNAGSRRLRSLTAAAFIVMTGIGLAWHTGWGTLSSFGIGSIAEVCPLGALEAMLAGPSCRRPSSDCWSSLPSSCFSDGSSAAGSVPSRFCAASRA